MNPPSKNHDCTMQSIGAGIPKQSLGTRSLGTRSLGTRSLGTRNPLAAVPFLVYWSPITVPTPGAWEPEKKQSLGTINLLDLLSFNQTYELASIHPKTPIKIPKLLRKAPNNEHLGVQSWGEGESFWMDTCYANLYPCNIFLSCS
jgi:hypothetical protein